jgi:hypothetical protein
MRREEDTSKTCKIDLTLKENLEKGRRQLRTLHSGWKQPSNIQKMAEKLKKTAVTKSTTISKHPSAHGIEQSRQMASSTEFIIAVKHLWENGAGFGTTYKCQNVGQKRKA